MTQSDWTILYDGDGKIEFHGDEIYIAPKTGKKAGDYHSAAIMNRQTMEEPLQDMYLRIEATTHRHLMQDTQPWHVFWVYFNYFPITQTEKIANYFILKTNGSEVGRGYNEEDQDFCVTPDEPKLMLGKRHVYEIEKLDQSLIVYIDGNHALTYDGNTGKYPLYDHFGSVVLYVEDAAVTVHSVEIKPVSDDQNYLHSTK